MTARSGGTGRIAGDASRGFPGEPTRRGAGPTCTMKTTTQRLIPTLAFAALFACAAVSAELSRDDRQFIEKAAESGMKEVDVSSSALPRLTTPAVREYAQMLVAHHTQANDELKALAGRKGVTLPAKDGDIARKWAKNDKDVVDDYLDEMVDDHKEAVKLFEKASKSSDPDIAAFAQKTLPKLRQHLELAQTHQKAKDN
jgi:putative membrane protein